MSMMQQYEQTSALFGGNAPFIEEQYEIYLANPSAVSAERSLFARICAKAIRSDSVSS